MATEMTDERRAKAIASIKATCNQSQRFAFLKMAAESFSEDLLSADVETRHAAIDAVAEVFHENFRPAPPPRASLTPGPLNPPIPPRNR